MNSESARKAIGLAAALGLALAAATARAAPQPNCPDKVNANTGQTIAAPGVAVSLTASGNFDIFTWSQTKGTAATLIPANGVGKQIQFVAPIVPAGGDSLTFEVRAEKAGCPTRRDAATINVTNPVVNRAPVAVAAASPAISDPEGTLVTLDGSASYDPDGATSLTYTWEQTSGVPVTLSGATSAIATFTTPDVGTAGATLQFRLTVWDGALTSAPATVTVNVTWVNAPPVAVATCPTTVSEREPLVLDGSGSGDVDDGIAA